MAEPETFENVATLSFMAITCLVRGYWADIIGLAALIGIFTFVSTAL